MIVPIAVAAVAAVTAVAAVAAVAAGAAVVQLGIVPLCSSTQGWQQG